MGNIIDNIMDDINSLPATRANGISVYPTNRFHGITPLPPKAGRR